MKAITLRALTAADWQPLLEFELRNRSWFEQHVEARGDAFYCQAGVEQHIAGYLQSYAARTWFPGLLCDATGAIVGRANLKDVDLQAGSAELGYRVGQDQAGRGVATAAVTQMKEVARQQWGLQSLRAVVTEVNRASIRVLEKNGFVSVAPSAGGPEQWNGLRLITYVCELGPPNA